MNSDLNASFTNFIILVVIGYCNNVTIRFKRQTPIETFLLYQVKARETPTKEERVSLMSYILCGFPQDEVETVVKRNRKHKMNTSGDCGWCYAFWLRVLRVPKAMARVVFVSRNKIDERFQSNAIFLFSKTSERPEKLIYIIFACLNR